MGGHSTGATKELGDPDMAATPTAPPGLMGTQGFLRLEVPVAAGRTKTWPEGFGRGILPLHAVPIRLRHLADTGTGLLKRD